MGRNESSREPSRLISASEVASWAYCPEQWRLSYAQGKIPHPKSRAVMRAGERHHAVNTAAERVAARAIRVGNRLVASTLLLLLLVVALLLAMIWR